MDTWTGFQAGLEGDWEMNIWLSRFGAVNMMEIQCLHSTQRPKIAGWLGYNSGAWINEEFDALADAFIEETDYTAKKALIDQAQELVAVEVPWLTLWSPKRIEAYRTDRYEDWYVQPLYGVNNDVGHWNWLVVKPVE
jgi:ABC-type transport system substrate-binding protein